MNYFNMAGRLLWASLLAILAFTVAERRPNFPCPPLCICGPSTKGDVDIFCMRNGSQVLHAEITFGTSFKVDCSIGSSDYDMLEGLTVGPVALLQFQFCPLTKALSKLPQKLNITGVKTLSLGQTNLTNIEKHFLINFSNITRLLLPRSGITTLPGNLLEDLTNLKSLDLVDNELQSIPVSFFSNVPNLIFLELGGNNISHLEPGTFKNLKHLKYLNLWGNSLQNISQVVFSGLTSLESLDLHYSELVSLTPKVFNDLMNLKHISLLKNNFSSLPKGLFDSTPYLETFKLFDNLQRLALAPGLLANLTKLNSVFLHRNNISMMPGDLLKGSTSIVTIRLEQNALTGLPESLFNDTKELQTLDISSNQLTSLPEGLFSSLTKLKVLKLANNRLITISGDTFKNLIQLEELSLERNKISYIHPKAFPTGQRCQIKRMYLAHNRLTFREDDNIAFDAFGSQSTLNACTKLQELYLTNNLITEICADWRQVMIELEKLDLSNNNMTVIRSEDLQFLSEKLIVNLSNNRITQVDMKFIEIHSESFQSTGNNKPNRNVQVLLKGNPVRCDCQQYNLLKYIEGRFSQQVYNFVYLKTDNLTCSSPEAVAGKFVSEIKSRTVTCDLTDDVAIKCPKPCSCQGRTDDGAFIVDCSSLGLQHAPEQLPWSSSWKYTEIHLERNRLAALPNLSQRGYDKVTRIFASHNNISSLDQVNLSPNLQILELNGNNLSYVTHSAIEVLMNKTQFQRIRLDNNPWQCDCEARDFLNYLQVHFRQVKNLSNISCVDGRPLSQLSANDLCPVSNAWIVALSVSVASIGIILGALAALYYRYQHEVKVWLYAKHMCLWFVTEEELDKDKHYDAFISYSHNDEEFVVNELVPGLETGPAPFKLCLHFRDWIPGEWITSQIARSVEDSRRTVVILSPNFLDSVWGRMEFRAAHKQALSDGRARVILLIYGELGPLDSLDPELRTYLSTNTYVKWGDPWFWSKLRYALPHPPQFRNKTGIICTPPASHINTAFDDKLELMQPTTPNPTTPPADTIVNPMNQANLMPMSLMNGHTTKLILDTNNHVNGCVKSV